MNPAISTAYLAALDELTAFVHSDAGKTWSDNWHPQLRDLLKGAAECDDMEQAKVLVNNIDNYIIEHGPVACGFLPSIECARRLIYAG